MTAAADWFRDAKLGIFIHWGIFAIPAYAPRGQSITEIVRGHPADGWARLPYTEWYANSIRFPQSPAAAHHRATYGDRPYESFRAEFDAASEAFDAGHWASLFAEAGAKYAVFVTKHHDGYCLWPTAVENPHRPGWHSKRDFVGELAEAVRARGLTFGTYYSGGLDWTFRHHPIGTFGDMMACVPYEDDYRAYAAAQYRELIARTGTAVLWNDIAYPDEGDRDALFADFRAARPDGVVNDRWMARRRTFEKMRVPEARADLDAMIAARWAAGEGDLMADSGTGDFRTPEYSEKLDFDRDWEACRGMDLSFGFNAEAKPEDHLSAAELIRSFVEIVAHGGNLLLNIGPRADGSVPEVQQDLLRALGAWLKTNGTAIYGTRRTAAPKGVASDGTTYRTTQTDGAVHVLFMAAPDARELTLPTLGGAIAAHRLDGGGVTLLAGDPVRILLDRPFDDAPVHVVSLEGAVIRDV
ncbi:hypothetical protein sos41_05090 [Alphaproteobacteria bacterium SO-S41]|nr:hypothetical protein sos41_05090 [Alphaproteobacteria bacterium SO-S41]